MFIRLSRMGGAAVLATISALLFTVGGRPQIGEYMPVSRPVVSFRSDSRDTIIMGDRPTSQMEHRPSSQMEHRLTSRMENRAQPGIVYNDEPFRPRVRSDQIQQSTVTNHDRSIVLDPTRAKDRKGSDEQPVWLPKSETQSTERRDGSTRTQVNPSHVQDKRGSTRPENHGPANRGQQSSASRPITRMGTIEATDEDYHGLRNESIGDARRVVAPNTSNKRNSGDIIFPGPTRDPTSPSRLKPRGSFAPKADCNEGTTFCESTDSYPSDYLNSVLKIQADTFKEFFGRDELNELTQRIDLPDETPLCPSLEQVVYPKMAQNKDDKWLYVVNQEPYVQGVRVEKCLKQESQCSLTEGFPLGYKTVCRQKYIYRRLLALNEDGKTHSDMFRLPSCCACFVKSVGTSTDSSTD